MWNIWSLRGRAIKKARTCPNISGISQSFPALTLSSQGPATHLKSLNLYMLLLWGNVGALILRTFFSHILHLTFLSAEAWLLFFALLFVLTLSTWVIPMGPHFLLPFFVFSMPGISCKEQASLLYFYISELCVQTLPMCVYPVISLFLGSRSCFPMRLLFLNESVLVFLFTCFRILSHRQWIHMLNKYICWMNDHLIHTQDHSFCWRYLRELPGSSELG